MGQGPVEAGPTGQGRPSLGPNPVEVVGKKEAEEVRIPAVPSSLERESWKQEVIEAVAAASNRPDQSVVHRWMFECTQQVGDPAFTVSLDNCPSDLCSLDAKLGGGFEGASQEFV